MTTRKISITNFLCDLGNESERHKILKDLRSQDTTPVDPFWLESLPEGLTKEVKLWLLQECLNPSILVSLLKGLKGNMSYKVELGFTKHVLFNILPNAPAAERPGILKNLLIAYGRDINALIGRLFPEIDTVLETSSYAWWGDREDYLPVNKEIIEALALLEKGDVSLIIEALNGNINGSSYHLYWDKDISLVADSIKGGGYNRWIGFLAFVLGIELGLAWMSLSCFLSKELSVEVRSLLLTALNIVAYKPPNTLKVDVDALNQLVSGMSSVGMGKLLIKDVYKGHLFKDLDFGSVLEVFHLINFDEDFLGQAISKETNISQYQPKILETLERTFEGIEYIRTSNKEELRKYDIVEKSVIPLLLLLDLEDQVRILDRWIEIILKVNLSDDIDQIIDALNRSSVEPERIIRYSYAPIRKAFEKVGVGKYVKTGDIVDACLLEHAEYEVDMGEVYLWAKKHIGALGDIALDLGKELWSDESTQHIYRLWELDVLRTKGESMSLVEKESLMVSYLELLL